MRMILTASVAILTAAASSFAQPDSVLVRTYPMGYPSAMCQTEDGGFLLTGIDPIADDSWILKLDQNGDSLWVTQGPRTDYLCSPIVQSEDGGVVLAGWLFMGFETGWYDIQLSHLDGNGGVVWSRTYGAGPLKSEHIYDMIRTREGGYALAGYTRTGHQLNNDLLFFVVDNNGDSLLYRDYGNGICKTLLQLDDGGFLFAGNNFMFRVNENGDSLWTRNISFNATDMLRDEDGNFLLTGIMIDEQRRYVTLMKLDENFDSLWTKYYDFYTQNGRDVTISILENDGFLLAGERGVQNNDQLFALRIDRDGDTLWSSSFNGGKSDCQSVVRTTQQGWAFAAGVETLMGWRTLFILSEDAPFLIENPYEAPVIVNNQGTPSRPTEVGVISAYPNPFNSSTIIDYTISLPGNCNIDIVDIAGRLVTRFSSEYQEAGNYREVWYAEEANAGLYFIRMNIGEFVVTQKLVLTK